jgi:hypothetical protein
LELEELQAHFNDLMHLADEYGIDTADLKKKQAEEQAAIEKKYADETVKKEKETLDKRLAAQQAMFSALGNLATAAGDLFAGEAGRQSKVSKAFTLAQIAIDTASAISSLTRNSESNPANAVTFGAAGVAQFAAGLARILVNIKRARDLFKTAPVVPQRYMGGFADVTGAEDGQQYRARYLGRASTGLLTNPGPVVLANERGREYYVDNASLRNPVVLNHVRAIENLKANAPFAPTGAAAMGTDGGMGAMMGPLMTLLAQLNTRLQHPIFAVVEDRTVVDIGVRQRKLTAASGGSIQQTT